MSEEIINVFIGVNDVQFEQIIAGNYRIFPPRFFGTQEIILFSSSEEASQNLALQNWSKRTWSVLRFLVRKSFLTNFQNLQAPSSFSLEGKDCSILNANVIGPIEKFL